MIEDVVRSAQAQGRSIRRIIEESYGYAGKDTITISGGTDRNDIRMMKVRRR